MPNLTTATAMALLFSAAAALAHGDVAPQPVNTDALPDIGEEWLSENPYRSMGPEVWATAVEIGASGFNQNCARCHGLQAVSGGLAPDLRFLEAEEYGDSWFVERFQSGYTQNGVTKMPAFGELLGQKAAWAIRTYIETRPDGDSLTAHSPRLGAIRDLLGGFAQAIDGGAAYESFAPQVAQARDELATIAAQITTASGAPVADSPAARAARAIDKGAPGVTEAFEVLTVGLSSAR